MGITLQGEGYQVGQRCEQLFVASSRDHHDLSTYFLKLFLVSAPFRLLANLNLIRAELLESA